MSVLSALQIEGGCHLFCCSVVTVMRTPSAHAHDMRRCEITETLTERQRKSARLIFGSFFIDEDEARKVSRRSDLKLDSLFCIVDERNVANIE